MKITPTEFLKKFGMNSGGIYWAGDSTVSMVSKLWSDYQDISLEANEDYLKMVDIFAKHLGIPQQIRYDRHETIGAK